MDLNKHIKGVLIHSGYITIADVMRHFHHLEKLQTGKHQMFNIIQSLLCMKTSYSK